MLAPASYSAFKTARSDARRAPYSFTRYPTQVANLVDVNSRTRPPAVAGDPLSASPVGTLRIARIHTGTGQAKSTAG